MGIFYIAGTVLVMCDVRVPIHSLHSSINSIYSFVDSIKQQFSLFYT